jgi:predicted ribosomally synthesized peptide with nif11-like leader
MSVNNARKFVEKMRQDHRFRNKILATSDQEELSVLLQSESLVFDNRELVGAMAECMQQLELEMSYC